MRLSKILFLFISAQLLFGCATTSVKHLNSAEFMEKSKYFFGSANSMCCIGVSFNRAYIEHADSITISGGRHTIIYWTELSRLPDDFIKGFKSDVQRISEWTEKERENYFNGNVPSDTHNKRYLGLNNAVILANRQMVLMGYDVIRMQVDAEFHDEPDSTVPVLIQNRCASHGYWAVHFSAGGQHLGGGTTVYVDAVTNEIICCNSFQK